MSRRDAGGYFRQCLNNPGGNFIRGLVLWYGLYQAVHLIVNAVALTGLMKGEISFPALPPAGGWSEQTIQFFIGMAGADLVNAMLSLVFVYGYLRRSRWRWWLGTVTLTVSIYAAVIFDYTTLSSGAWADNLAAYLFINLAFLPVVLLSILLCAWTLSGEAEAEDDD